MPPAAMPFSRYLHCPGALAQDPASCASYGKLDFFPRGYLNQPAAWTRENQLKAGNTDHYSLFPIVLYGNPWPKLHFLPIHPLLLPRGVPVPEGCRGPAAPSRRHLLGEFGSVVTPAAFRWSVSLDGGHATPGFSTMVLTNLTDMPQWEKNVWALKDVSAGGW